MVAEKTIQMRVHPRCKDAMQYKMTTDVTRKTFAIAPRRCTVTTHANVWLGI